MSRAQLAMCRSSTTCRHGSANVMLQTLTHRKTTATTQLPLAEPLLLPNALRPQCSCLLSAADSAVTAGSLLLIWVCDLRWKTRQLTMPLCKVLLPAVPQGPTPHANNVLPGGIKQALSMLAPPKLNVMPGKHWK